ncbi:MAG: asparagine synthase (glutamine-hydrolyzing) [Syntrophales bacterium]
MCGIAGYVDFDRHRSIKGLLCRMIGIMKHRGPDASGIYEDDFAGLASRRLSILDIAGGDQPIHNEEESVWVVYNGEVFNYPEIRNDLEKRDHRFYTKSDTEVLVHLYEECGTDLCRHLNGQFAFAIWDRVRDRLILGRDRLGVRPLFYYEERTRLIFGSEIKAVFADPAVPREMDLRTLSDIFTFWAPLGSMTAFKGIYQIPPGHTAVFSRSGLSLRPFWKIGFENSGNSDRPFHEYREELKYLIRDAVRIRLRADVPVGAYLSGGLDSTYITALVKKYFNNRLCTFSVGFTDGRFDETAFQEKVVHALETDHKSTLCAEADIGRVFPEVIWHSEVPILRTAPAPLFLLSRLVRDNGYKVVLTGEGSDEIFAGYDIFKEDKIRRFWSKDPQSGFRPMLFRKIYPDVFDGQSSRTGQFLNAFFQKGLQDTDSKFYSHMIRWENTGCLRQFFSDEVKEELRREGEPIERFLSTLPGDFMKWDALSRAQYIEMTIFLSNYLLSSQGDRMAMANSVEGRFPFLDHRVIEFALRTPSCFRLHGLKDKFILRKAAMDTIPPDIAMRGKRPYRAPVSRCFFADTPAYVEELLSDGALRKSGYFHPGRVGKIIEKCRKQEGCLLSERENMALTGILSTQLLDHLFIRNFSSFPVRHSGRVLIFPPPHSGIR